MFILMIPLIWLMHICTPALAYVGTLWGGPEYQDAIYAAAQEAQLGLIGLSFKLYRAEICD